MDGGRSVWGCAALGVTSQRGTLLLALGQQPDVLVLDEPTAGLDPVVTDQLLRVLVEDVASEGRTVFLSSHHLAEVERIADWVGMIDRGKLLLEAPMEELRAKFRRIQVAGVAGAVDCRSFAPLRMTTQTTPASSFQ